MFKHDERKLFRVTNAKSEIFYVVCKDESQAAMAANDLWMGWNYLGDGRAVKVELIAEARQYPTKGVNWLEIV